MTEGFGGQIGVGNEVYPSDEAFIGISPLMTLITAFVLHGLDPMF